METYKIRRTSPLRNAEEFNILEEKINEKAQGRRCVFVASPGNFGDALINIGSRQFFDDRGIAVEELSRKKFAAALQSDPSEFLDAVVIVGGGGGWSRTFGSTKHFVDSISRNCWFVIVLPTTFELAPPTGHNVLTFARDRSVSMNANPGAIFCHDMAFYLDLEVAIPNNQLWRLFAFRTDREGHGFASYFPRNVDVSLFGSGEYVDAQSFFNLIATFENVFTDRLHVAIGAALIGKNVSLVGGTYPKNRGVFEASLSPHFSRVSFKSFETVYEQVYPGKALPTPKADVSSKDPEKRFSRDVWKISKTNPAVLPVNSSLYREPPRDPTDFTPGYLQRYDGHTILADIFNSGDRLLGIGPPLLNLKETADNAIINLNHVTRAAESSWEDLNRISRLSVPLWHTAEHVQMLFGSETFDVTPSPDDSDIFRDSNVVVTLSKDNPLVNVRDWLTNLVVNHEINGAIIYDNGSSSYTQEELLEVMESIAGLDNGIVVDWPYKYGNTGGPSQIWDSDFGQYMCWEHARWRYLSTANCVVISDVDEIPVSSSQRNLVTIAEETPHGVYSYPVRDCPPVPRDKFGANRQRLHTDYVVSDSKRGAYSRKVVYMPKRIPVNSQVGNHQVIGVSAEYSEEVITRHVVGVHYAWRNRDWSYSNAERVFDSRTDFEDDELLAQYLRTFPERFHKR